MHIMISRAAVACLTATLISFSAQAGSESHTPLALPAAAGSLGANLVRGASDQLVLSWLEPDGDGHALRYSAWQDDGWQPPATVARGDNWFVNWADFPSVVPVRGAFWTAHWLVRRPAGGYAYDVHVALSRDAGESWGESFPVHRDNTDTEHGFVSTYTNSKGAGLVWLDGRKTGDEQGQSSEGVAGMTLRTATLEPDSTLTDEQELDGLICDCCQTDVTVTRDGPVAVYRDRTADEVRDIYIARHLDGAWQPGEPVANDGWVIPGCPVNGPVVASNGAEVVVAWFTAANNDPRVRLARSASPGDAFTVPLDVVSGSAVGRVGLALLADGSAVVSALRSAGAGRAELTLTRVSKDGDLGEPYSVATRLPPFSVPQLAAVGDELVVIWSVREDGRSGLEAARVPVSVL